MNRQEKQDELHKKYKHIDPEYKITASDVKRWEKINKRSYTHQRTNDEKMIVGRHHK